MPRRLRARNAMRPTADRRPMDAISNAYGAIATLPPQLGDRLVSAAGRIDVSMKTL
jgi:hypothetical protein